MCTPPPFRTPPFPKTHQLRERQPLLLAQPTVLSVQMSKLMLSNSVYPKPMAEHMDPFGWYHRSDLG